MAIKPVEILITAKDKASEVFGGLKATAVAAGVAIAGYFGVKLFKDSVAGAAELEAQLSDVKAVSGATAAEMGLLKKAAEDAGASTKFTATEAAAALGELARSGMDANKSIAALPATLALATGGKLALDEAAGLVTKTLAAFGLEAEKSGLVADVLAKGANASNTSVRGLGEGLSYAAPTAKSLNLSLETTVALLGKFADGGIDASRGGTALNAIMSQFLDPASRFRQELAAAGITTNNFEDALRQLAAAGPAGAKAILAVGTEAGPALRSLLNQGIGAFDDLKNKLNDATGSAAAFAAETQNNLQGSLQGLGSAWDTVKNKLGEPVLPILKDGVTQLTTALREAVQDGTVGRFGTAIASGFQSALTWARSFLAEVDFDALSAKVSGAADKVGAAFAMLEAYAKNTGNSVALIWGVMSSGANGVLAVVYTVGEAFAGVASNIQSGVALILDGLSKITFGGVSASFKAAADDMRISAEATWAASEDLAAKAGQALTNVAEGAETAREGWAGLTEDSATAAAQADTSAKAFEQVGNTLTAMAEKATAAGQQTTTALAGVGQQAQATQAEVAAAFERMGVKTQASLQQAANNALRDFDLIKSSGQATTDGLAKAWQQYAEAAIAANGGVATETLKAQAALQGLEVVVDATGKAIVRAMGSGTSAAEGYTRTITAATQAVQTHLTWLDRLEKRNAEVKSTLITDKEGFSVDGDGKRIVQAVDNRTSAASKLEGMGLEEAVAKRLAALVYDERGNYIGKSSGAYRDGDSADAVLSRLAKQSQGASEVGRGSWMTYEDGSKSYDLNNHMRKNVEAGRHPWNDGRGGLPAQVGGGSSAGGAAVGRTVNVNINTPAGRETVTTDEQGAAALVRTLQTAGLAARG